MRRTPLAVLIAAVTLVAAAPADAATYVLRPSATPLQAAGWTANPAGQAAHALLDDEVVQPQTPSTSTDLLTAGSGLGQTLSVSFDTGAVPAGETVTDARVWLHARAVTRALALSTWSGIFVQDLGSVAVGSAGWTSLSVSKTAISSPVPPTLTVMGDKATGSTVEAAYLEVTTVDPAAAPEPTGAVALPAVPGALLPSGKAAKEPAPAAAGADPTPTTGPAALVALPPAIETIVADATARTVPVDLACPPDASGACRGRIVFAMVGLAKARFKKARARAARCARGCRVIGEGNFTIASGRRKPIKVKLRKSAFRLLPKGGSARVRVTITSRDRAHAPTRTSRIITLQRAAA
jgi:hypothetical protein